MRFEKQIHPCPGETPERRWPPGFCFCRGLMKAGVSCGKICSKSIICFVFTGGIASLLWPGFFPFPACLKTGDCLPPHNQQRWQGCPENAGKRYLCCAQYRPECSEEVGVIICLQLNEKFPHPWGCGSFYLSVNSWRQKTWYLHMSSSFRDRKGFVVSEHWAYCRGIWTDWINELRPIIWGSTRPSAGSCTLVTTTPCNAQAWGKVAGELPGGKGPWGVGWQQAEHEPALCPGGQEGQQHPGLDQE